MMVHTPLACEAKEVTMPIQDRVSFSLLSGALPTDTQVDRGVWQALLSRADNLPLGRSGGHGLGDTYVDAFEAAGVASLIANGGHRFYADEQALSPLLSGLLHTFDANDFVAVPPGDTSLPAVTQDIPASIPVASIRESDLLSVAKRLAETRPGNEDGDSANLKYSDRDVMPETLTRRDRMTIAAIRSRYFTGTAQAEWTSKTVEVEAHDNSTAGVRVVLRRNKKARAQPNRASGAEVGGTIENHRLEITAPVGARIIYQYQKTSRRGGRISGTGIAEADADGKARLDVRNGEPMDYHIMIIHDADGQGPGMPRVLDSIRLKLPAAARLG